MISRFAILLSSVFGPSLKHLGHHKLWGLLVDKPMCEQHTELGKPVLIFDQISNVLYHDCFALSSREEQREKVMTQEKGVMT